MDQTKNGLGEDGYQTGVDSDHSLNNYSHSSSDIDNIDEEVIPKKSIKNKLSMSSDRAKERVFNDLSPVRPSENTKLLEHISKVPDKLRTSIQALSDDDTHKDLLEHRNQLKNVIELKRDKI